MPKKIVLALLLLSLVVAVSYIKGVRGNSADDGQSGRHGSELATSPDNELTSYESNLDSLKGLVEIQSDSFSVMLTEQRIHYGRRIDSLFDLLDSVECQLDEMKLADAVSDSAESADLVARQKEAVAESARVALEGEIVDYYKGLYSELPGDLSSYERRVSLYEIRLQTAKEYGITLSQLKEIRNTNDLTY